MEILEQLIQEPDRVVSNRQWYAKEGTCVSDFFKDMGKKAKVTVG